MPSLWAGALNPSLAMRASMRPERSPVTGTPRDFYEVLDDYYRNNALYESLHARAVAVGIIDPTILGLKNPANRVVEFYAKKCWPGALPSALPLTATKPGVIDAVHKLWKDSNWSAQKTVWAREVALYGDGFLKVSTKNGPATIDAPRGVAKRVYLQRIDPKLVTDFTTDERGFLTMIRLDEQQDPIGPDGQPQIEGPIRWRTEIWNKTEMAVWTHTLGVSATVEQLATPDPGYPIPLGAWGIDFVPFVHAKFRDIGDDRGISSFQHALDKIDELDKSATRLNAQLYRHNDNTWVLSAQGRDASGRPMTQLTFGKKKDGSDSSLPVYNIAGTRLFSLPGNYGLDSLVPKLDYNASLAVVINAMEELNDDLPEMAYYRTRDFGTNMSGVALTLILGPAIGNAEEMRGNVQDAVVRAHQMAITIGDFLGIEGYTGLGKFEDGDLDHEFASRPVIPMTQVELLAVAAQKQALGVPKRVILVRDLNYNEEEVNQWMDEAKQAEADSLAAQQQQMQLDATNVQNTQNRVQAIAASPLVADALNKAQRPDRTNPGANGARPNGR